MSHWQAIAILNDTLLNDDGQEHCRLRGLLCVAIL